MNQVPPELCSIELARRACRRPVNSLVREWEMGSQLSVERRESIEFILRTTRLYDLAALSSGCRRGVVVIGLIITPRPCGPGRLLEAYAEVLESAGYKAALVRNAAARANPLLCG